ncbi:MAG: 3-dehydroquinate synthase, partial [Candidatus Dormibacteraeota bacterium]|nr:3-dehydroquinate synthase [Candidatus Dormibacteraeota bacterium]
GVAQALTGAGIDVAVHQVPAGEQAKSFGQLQQVLAFLEREHIDRRGVVVAVGGGTVSDVAGFAAAIWLRGVQWVGVPTTLLAMVDSSVGGKTGINTEETKNGIGAFWQPAAVVSDLATLSTLPEGEVTSAFGEIVKYGVAMDERLADRLLREAAELQAREEWALEQVVDRCVELKAEVIAADERDTGGRAVLNYGHTVGHAIEAASGYQATHGRAISQGMRVAARLAVAQRLCDAEVVARQEALLDAYRLPGPLPPVTADQVLAALPRDKKATGGRIGWVLPRRLGRCQVGVTVPPDVVERCVREVIGA